MSRTVKDTIIENNNDNDDDDGEEIGADDMDGEGRMRRRSVLPVVAQVQQQHQPQQPQQTMMENSDDDRRLITDSSMSVRNEIASTNNDATLLGANRMSNTPTLREPVLPGEVINAKNTIGTHQTHLEWGMTTAPSQFAMQGDQNTTVIDRLTRMSTLGNTNLLRSATLPSGEIIDAKNTVGTVHSAQRLDDDSHGNYNRRQIDRLLQHTDETTAGVENICGRGGAVVESGFVPSSQTTEANPTTNDASTQQSRSINDSLTTPIIVVMNDTNPTRHDVHDPLLVIAQARFVRDGSTAEPIPSAPENTTSNTDNSHPVSRKSLQRILCVSFIVLIAAIAGVVGFLVCDDDGCSSSDASIPSLAPNRPFVTSVGSPIPTSIPRTPTSAPAVSEEQAEQVIGYINKITLSGRTFIGPNTSRGTINDASEQALAWIICDDPMRLLPDTPSRQFQLVQRYALRTIISQQSFPNRWSQSTWALSECDWFGINCTSMRMGNETGEKRLVVTSIDFIGIILKGILPADLGLLSFLLYLDISLSNLLGTVPESIGNWKSITHVHLHENQLTGSLPSSIGNWRNLTSLFLHTNELTGSLPSSLGNWHKISYIDFGYNSITGSLPYSTGNWSNLLSILIDHNSLTGSIPSSVGNWASVTLVDLSFNSLTGMLPSSLGNWQFLEFVDISQNRLKGTFPSTIATGWTNVTDVYLSTNMFTGVVPTDWCELTSLNRLWADCNAEVTCNCCTACL